MTAKHPSEVYGPYLDAARELLPHGYIIVPKEPTEAMLKAGYQVISRQNGLHQVATASEFIWEAMIVATTK